MIDENLIESSFDRDVLEHRGCIRSRQVFAYLEMSSMGSSDIAFSDHIASCSICQKRVKKFNDLASLIEKSIPDVKMNDEIEEHFKAELQEFLRLKRKTIEKLSRNDNDDNTKIKSYVYDFCSVFFNVKTIALIVVMLAIIYFLQRT